MTHDIGGAAIPEQALRWKFLRASGPGGQHVNKVSTAVECRLHLERAGIAGAFRRRLERLAGSRLTAAGEIVVFADAHRIQSRNRADALNRLAALIEQARQPPKPRIPTRPTAASRLRRLAEKKQRGERKRSRRSIRHDD